MNKGIVSVDIGGSHITSVMVDDLKKGSLATNTFRNKIASKSSLPSIMNGWYENISYTIQKAPDIFSGKIAIAIPGPFDYENGRGLYTDNGKFMALKNIDIRTKLSTLFPHGTEFHFENDAACFGLGECHFGLIKNHTKSMAITLGTGIGCTFLDNQNVIKQGHKVPMGGEIYHLHYKKSIADDYFSTRWFVNEAKEKYGFNISGVKELALAESNSNHQKIFKDFSNNLSEFLLPIALRFGAESIVFGGNISKAWTYFSKHLCKVFNDSGIIIYQSDLNEKAVCLGAAISFVNKKSKDSYS